MADEPKDPAKPKSDLWRDWLLEEKAKRDEAWTFQENWNRLNLKIEERSDAGVERQARLEARDAEWHEEWRAVVAENRAINEEAMTLERQNNKNIASILEVLQAIYAQNPPAGVGGS